jgi:phosphate transport system substrate-binding protein
MMTDHRLRGGVSFAVAIGSVALLALATFNVPASATERLVLTGSSTIAPLAAEIGKRFEETHPNVRVDVQTGGSSRGVRDAREGLADIGMVSRSLKDSESDLRAYLIGLDGISLIVNKSNPVSELTTEQIVAIYTGKIRDWSEVGGRSGQIVTENKAEGRSTLELFLDHFKLTSPQIKADIVVGDNEQAIKVITGNEQAIGYVSIGSAVYSADNGLPIKPLPLNGVAPTIDAVKSKQFPIVRELNLVVSKEPSGLVKEFLEYAQSPKVTDLVKDLFYVPVQ